MRDRTISRPPCRINFYSGGVELKPRSQPGNPTGKGAGRRGKVAGFSLASRRRLRQVLMRSTADGIPEAVTLTIPGPVQPLEWCKTLWHRFARYADRAGLTAIWRLEIQERGALHWHLRSWRPEGSSETIWRDTWRASLSAAGEVPIPEGTYAFRDEADLPNGEHMLGLVRYPDIDISGFYDSDDWAVIRPFLPPPGEDLWRWPDLTLWPGANLYAAKVLACDGRGNWLRYLCDHETKSKQAQVPVSMGRHWGIIGRCRLRGLLPEVCDHLPEDQYARVRRWFERLVRGTRKDPAAPFGRRLGWPRRFGRRGAAVRFCSPATVRRMIEEARKTPERSIEE